MAKRRDHEWWRLLGCGLPWIPVLFVGVPIFYLGILVMNERARRSREQT
jgi:hypothetical protein